MCGPIAAIASIGMTVASTAISAAGQNAAAKAQAQSYKDQAKQYEIQKTLNRVEAEQAAMDRFEEFRELDSMNLAIAGASGLSVDSFAGVREDNRKDALEDLDRIYMQADVTDKKLEFQRSDARESARIAKGMGKLQVAGTIASGLASAANKYAGYKSSGSLG